MRTTIQRRWWNGLNEMQEWKRRYFICSLSWEMANSPDATPLFYICVKSLCVPSIRIRAFVGDLNTLPLKNEDSYIGSWTWSFEHVSFDSFSYFLFFTVAYIQNIPKSYNAHAHSKWNKKRMKCSLGVSDSEIERKMMRGNKMQERRKTWNINDCVLCNSNLDMDKTLPNQLV